MEEFEVAVIVEVRNSHMFRIADIDCIYDTETTVIPLTSLSDTYEDNGKKGILQQLSDYLSNENIIIDGVKCFHNYESRKLKFNITTSYINGKLMVSATKDLTNIICDDAEYTITADPIVESDKMIRLKNDGVYILIFDYDGEELKLNIVKKNVK